MLRTYQWSNACNAGKNVIREKKQGVWHQSQGVLGGMSTPSPISSVSGAGCTLWRYATSHFWETIKSRSRVLFRGRREKLRSVSSNAAQNHGTKTVVVKRTDPIFRDRLTSPIPAQASTLSEKQADLRLPSIVRFHWRTSSWHCVRI